MTEVQITRHFSGFTNVADKFSVGNHEAEGSATLSIYKLPAGYTVSDGKIYDPSGIECLITAENGHVTLVSYAGKHADVVIKEVA